MTMPLRHWALAALLTVLKTGGRMMNAKGKMLATGLLIAAIAGCANTGVIPLSANTAQITVESTGACTSTQTQQLALKHAAVTTLQRGFDRFVITSVGDSSKLAAIHQPTTATRRGNTTTITGGTQWWESPKTTLTVEMYRATERESEKALDARSVLGHDWAKIVHEGAPNTCW